MERRTFLWSAGAAAPVLGALVNPGEDAKAQAAIVLPKPKVDGGKPLLWALSERKTNRNISPEALKVRPNATVLFDLERIFYGQVKSIANPDFPIQAPLGASNGPGFGWHDINVEKVGLGVNVSPNLTLRAGFNHSGLPFERSQTLFNLLAPAVAQEHISFGATWRLQSGKEINIAYQHAFGKTLNGSGSIPEGFGGGNANLRMYQSSVGVGFGWGK